MLAQIKIKDFAIIDDLKIDFNDKMTVLTGETGSGKSIIIDAINLLLGERAANEMIRYDCDKAVIEGIFYYDNPDVNNLLNEYGIEADDTTLIINREIAKNGRNLCRLNGSLITVNQLKQIGSLLVDVHVQHDTTRLINTNNYLYLLDSFTDEFFRSLIKEYRSNYEGYLAGLKKYQKLVKEHKENQEKLDFYKFQFEEFKQAKINTGEYEELSGRRDIYVNYDKIFENLNTAYNNISDNKILEKIYDSASHLSKIAQLSDHFKQISDELFSIYYQLEDQQNELYGEINTIDYDPKELDRIESRLSIYSGLKRKYKMEVPELINYRDDLALKIRQIDNYDEVLEETEKAVITMFEKTMKTALMLREIRKRIAKDIETRLVGHLQDLRLANTVFQINFNELKEQNASWQNASVLNEDGFDTVDFFVTFNLGEPMHPLSKVASGGELSRFMLALKTILTEKQKLSTIIFDEIDTGVGGITASAIAQKLKKISNNTQVLCITHLPQVASMADYHLFISKEEKNERTVTNVKLLNDEERIQEIAKMIAGSAVNDIAIQNAKNLLNKNE